MNGRSYIIMVVFLFFTLGCHAAWCQMIFKEKVVVFTDRPWYAAGESVWLSINVLNASTFRSSELSRVVYVELVDSLGNRITGARYAVNKGRAHGVLQIGPELKTGNYRLISYTRWMRNFSSAAFFQKHLLIINPSGDREPKISADQLDFPISSDKLSITTSASTFGVRKPVQLELSSPKGSTKIDLVVSVFKVDSSLVESALKYDVPGEKTNPARDTVNTFKYRFAPEIKGPWVTGRVVPRENKLRAKIHRVYAVVPGFAAGFYNTRTDSLGRFSIEIDEPASADSLILLLDTASASKWLIIPDDPFEHAPVDTSFTGSTLAVSAETLHDVSDAIEIAHYFNSPVIGYAKPQNDSVPFYGTNDLIYNLDDYTRFSKMEEVFREYVQLVNVNRRNGHYHLSVYNESYGKLFENDPLVLIDGYPVFNLDRLFEFSPLKIQYVQVATRRFFRGYDVYDGIVNLLTYSRNLNSFKIDAHAIALHDFLIQKPSLFVSPKYSTEQSARDRNPDFRPLLYWQPHVELSGSKKQNIEFYTSDMLGTYLIEAKGLNEDGKLLYGRKLITVTR